MNPIFAYTISFLGCYTLFKLWVNHLGNSMLEMIILFSTLVFVKEVSIYFIYSVTNYINMPFDIFMINRGIISIVLNVFTIIILYLLLEVKINFDNQKAVVAKSNESLFLKRFKK